MDDQKQKINLNFTLLTGGNFSLSVESDITVDVLKKIVSKKLKISKDRICLMNSERWEFFFSLHSSKFYSHRKSEKISNEKTHLL
jgi:hypothetical protein